MNGFLNVWAVRALNAIVAAITAVVFLSIVLRFSGVPLTLAWVGRRIVGNFGLSRHYGVPVVSVLLPRLLPTAELIVASFVIAAAAGLCVWPLAARLGERRRALLLASVASIRGIPSFWLACMAAFLVSMHVKNPAALGIAAMDHFDPWDRLAHIIGPVLVLALFQLPLMVAYLSQQDRAPKAGDLAVMFASHLPEVVGAVLFAELFFGLPGHGRLFFLGPAGEFNLQIGLLLFWVSVALLARLAASPFAPKNNFVEAGLDG